MFCWVNWSLSDTRPQMSLFFSRPDTWTALSSVSSRLEAEGGMSHSSICRQPSICVNDGCYKLWMQPSSTVRIIALTVSLKKLKEGHKKFYFCQTSSSSHQRRMQKKTKKQKHHHLNSESVLEAINLHDLLFLARVTFSLPNTLQ